MAGSILPVTIYRGKLHLLFGLERETDDTPGWSDFGGGAEKGESHLETAIREGGEELTGFLGSSADLRQLLRKYGTYNIDFQSKGHDVYRCHLFPMEYNEMLPFYYNNNQRFIQARLDPKIIQNTKIFEKAQIKWFSVNEMKQKRSQFRSFYQDIVDLIWSQRKEILEFLGNGRSGNGRSGNKRTKKRRHKGKGTSSSRRMLKSP
jgi:hypothetical protein